MAEANHEARQMWDVVRQMFSGFDAKPVGVVEPARCVRRLKPKPSPPVLIDLPRVTAGKYKNEYVMTVAQFAGHCGVAVATVRDWMMHRTVECTRHGTRQQSRVTILSGERERRLTRIQAKTQRALTMRLD
jgi:hypothetical protein